jgi:hypothetical protein
MSEPENALLKLALYVSRIVILGYITAGCKYCDLRLKENTTFQIDH